MTETLPCPAQLVIVNSKNRLAALELCWAGTRFSTGQASTGPFSMT